MKPNIVFIWNGKCRNCLNGLSNKKTIFLSVRSCDFKINFIACLSLLEIRLVDNKGGLVVFGYVSPFSSLFFVCFEILILHTLDFGRMDSTVAFVPRKH